LGIIAAAGMPLACLTAGTRKAAFKNTLVYYLTGIWPMVPGLDRYFGQSASSLIPVAMWVLAAILLSVPWTIAWTSKRFHCPWRVPLPLMVTIVPPLGIVGLASPVTFPILASMRQQPTVIVGIATLSGLTTQPFRGIRLPLCEAGQSSFTYRISWRSTPE
jgi:hypothetical protein